MKLPRVKISDCSYDMLVRIAQRCGFIIHEGRKHCKIKTQGGAFVTMIPRHSRLKRETAKSIVESLQKYECPVGYS